MVWGALDSFQMQLDVNRIILKYCPDRKIAPGRGIESISQVFVLLNVESTLNKGFRIPEKKFRIKMPTFSQNASSFHGYSEIATHY